MSQTANQEMKQLAEKFSLVEDGKVGDFYSLHGKWCVTKKGAESIAKQIGMTHTEPKWYSVDGVTMAFSATFTDADGNSCWELGSCRYDGTKNTPERQYPYELAEKRMLVRATLRLVGMGGSTIVGADEMPTDWHKHGNNAPAEAEVPATPMATPAHLAPATTPANAPQPVVRTNNPDQTTDYSQDPRFAQASRADGWNPNAVKLPSEWNQAMGEFCELTNLQRGDWETLLLDHCGKFESPRGWWKPSQKYQKYDDIVFHVDTYNGANKSKSGQALMIKKNLIEDVIGTLKMTGKATIAVPDSFGELQSYEIIPEPKNVPMGEDMQNFVSENTPTIANEPPKTVFDDTDVPF